jgi:LuxR family maltose regulon positive regulatory protein
VTSAKAASWVVPRTALLNRLASATEPVIAIVAPAGSGKTVLLSSWMAQLGPAVRVASLSVDRDERDAQRFWLSVAQELSLAGARVEVPAPAPQFDARQLVDRLAEDIAHLDEGVLLAIDDLHELKSPEAIAALERFIERRPANLRLVLAMRHDMALGLHRLRVAGDLLELRAADMDFALDETRALLAASGINLAEDDVQLLHERTEGWAAGLRLAALSLSGVPDPHHLVAQFSGSERTVADYLLAEVLSRQSDDVRQLLLRTSIVDRVNSSLADALTGKPGSGPILLELERDGVFVVPSSGDRTWLRYHQLFADLLRLELRRTHPEEVVPLHLAAAGWYEAHGMIIEAIRQTQAAEDWTAATHLLADNVLALALDGHSDTIGALLRTFPADRTMDPERALVTAGYELIRGSLNDAAAYADTAERLASEVDPQRRARFNTSLIVAKSAIARRRGDQQLVAAEMAAIARR